MASEKLANADRKDRSIRLWGERGQYLLEQGHVCVLNATVVGTEVLKNLVLPGIGKFTIVDNKRVTERDLGNNFFVEESCVGEPRCQVITRLLVEMNDEVVGKFYDEDPVTVINDNIGYFSSIGATCIVATDLPEAALRKLGQHCWANRLPLFIGRAYGMIGTWRNVLAEHCIVESRPEYSKENFRLTEPFPELQAFADRFDLTSCTHPFLPLTETPAAGGGWVDAQGKTCAPRAHSHVPAFVVLMKALAGWRAGHGGQLPRTSEEKEAFKASLEGLKVPPRPRTRASSASPCRVVAEGAGGAAWAAPAGGLGEACEAAGQASALVEEDNITEAVGMARHAYAPFDIPSEVRALLHDDKVTASDKPAEPFWLILRALSRFVAGEGAGHLPLSGGLPDMHADTRSYVELHKLYRAQAAKEHAAVAAHLAAVLAAAGLPPEAVPQEDLAQACRHSCDVRMVRTRSVEEEHAAPAAEDWAWMLEVEGREYPHAWYLLLRAADRFRATQGRWPGEGEDGVAELARFREVVGGVCADMGVPPSRIEEELVQEMVRYGGSELHSIAAVVGGMGAQEVTKVLLRQFSLPPLSLAAGQVLLRQFVPASGTFIFNGVTGKSALCVF